jgi:hypothetical protein
MVRQGCARSLARRTAVKALATDNPAPREGVLTPGMGPRAPLFYGKYMLSLVVLNAMWDVVKI